VPNRCHVLNTRRQGRTHSQASAPEQDQCIHQEWLQLTGTHTHQIHTQRRTLMLYLPRLCSSTPSVATTKYVRYNAYMHALTCTTHTHTQIQTAAHTHTHCALTFCLPRLCSSAPFLCCNALASAFAASALRCSASRAAPKSRSCCEALCLASLASRVWWASCSCSSAMRAALLRKGGGKRCGSGGPVGHAALQCTPRSYAKGGADNVGRMH